MDAAKRGNVVNVEETREALSYEVDSDNPYYKEIMRLADSYGAARALAAHVDVCERKTGERRDTDSTIHTNRALLCCGEDGWYCPKVKAIKELGKEPA